MSLQLCPTLCDPMDYSSSGSSVHGILQARILEWVAMPSSRGSFPPRDQTRVSYVYLPWQVGCSSLAHLGSPLIASEWRLTSSDDDDSEDEEDGGGSYWLLLSWAQVPCVCGIYLAI